MSRKKFETFAEGAARAKYRVPAEVELKKLEQAFRLLGFNPNQVSSFEVQSSLGGEHRRVRVGLVTTTRRGQWAGRWRCTKLIPIRSTVAAVLSSQALKEQP